MRIDEVLQEGPNDPHIFKAIFLAGGPGSGKSFVANRLLGGTGLRTVNSDDIYEYMMSKQGMGLDPETIFSPAGQDTREKAKEITDRKQQSHIDGRLGLIIDGTGKNVEKYKKTKKMLEDLGYETMMLFVNTSHDVAQERNLQRPRSLEPKSVTKMWNAVQDNLMAFQQLFGAQNFYLVDNSGGLEDPDRQKNFTRLRKDIDRFLNAPPRRPEARRWLDAQRPDVTDENLTEDEPVTKSQLDALERAADRVFGKLGIDIEFTRHFLDRVNDERNRKQITIKELGELFAKEYKRWGKTIAKMPVDAEAVMKDLSSAINIPFVLNPDGKEKDLVAKTVMRKKDFKTPDRQLPVESVNESSSSLSQWENKEPAEYVTHLTKTLGTPEELTNKRAVWYNVDGFKRIEVLDEYILHSSPTPHYDYVYSYVDLKVPHQLSDDLAKSSESILIDHLKAEVGGRCASLSANAVTIQYVIDVVENNTKPSKLEYEKRIKSMKKMFNAGKVFKLDWWPDLTKDADPKNLYYKTNLNEHSTNKKQKTNEATNPKDLINYMRKSGWSVYVSRSPHGSGNDKRLEFEKDGVEFEILGSKDRWELFRAGPTLSGKGEVYDSLRAAIDAATIVSESKKPGKKKNTNQLKGKESMPAKTKPKTHAGSQRHPHRGKLVGGS